MKYFNLSNTVLLALKDWGRANSNCGATFGGSLAAPSTELENAYIRQQLTKYYAAVNPSEQVRVWMGLYEYLNYTTNIAYWRFTNGEPYTYADWSRGEPYLDPFASFTGNILSGQFFHWAVWEGRSAYPYVCEHKL